jgi:hypothetical protein
MATEAALEGLGVGGAMITELGDDAGPARCGGAVN